MERQRSLRPRFQAACATKRRYDGPGPRKDRRNLAKSLSPSGSFSGALSSLQSFSKSASFTDWKRASPGFQLDDSLVVLPLRYFQGRRSSRRTETDSLSSLISKPAP